MPAAPAELMAGDVQIRIAPESDPLNPIFDTGTLFIAAGSDLVLTAVDNTTTSSRPITVIAMDNTQIVEFLDESVESPPAAASRQELEVEIQEAITRLSPKMRVITVLRYTESLSYEEIADTLGISLGTVKSRLSRAHAALDRELTPVVDRHLLR